MPLFNGKDTQTVGLDIDGEYVAAAIVNDGSVGRLASTALPPGATSDGEVVDQAALTGALKELFGRHKLPKRVRLGVANQHIVVRHLDMPLIKDPAERQAAVRFQAADAIAMPLDDAVLDFVTIGAYENSEGSVRERLLVVAARSSMVDALVAAVKAAGLKPDGIDLNAFALVRVLATHGPGPAGAEEPTRAICHLGAVTNLAVERAGVCLFARPVQTAWAPDESVVNSVAEEVRLSLDYYAASADSQRVSSVVLTGPGASDEGISRAIRERTGLEVEVAAPLGDLGVHTVPSLDDPSRYTVAAGLAMGVEA